VQLNFWVNGWLASKMSEGSMSGLSVGFSLMLMAQAAIAQSVAIAAMPTFSAQHALGKMDEMRGSLVASLRGVMLIALPASLGLIVLREPLVRLLYQRGEFNDLDAQMVAWALLWYAAGLVGHSLMEVLTRAFYAQHDTRTPVLIGAVAMGLNVVFSFAFSAGFESMGWLPLGGLALANSLATALEAAALFLFMRTRLGGLNGPHLLRGFGAAALSALGMTLGLLAWIRLTGGQHRAVTALGGVLLGGLVYGLGLLALQVPEIKMLTRLVLARLRR
jgi:putative peptidoglycan lipid II flippase